MDHKTRESWHDQPIPVLTAQFRTDVQQGLAPSSNSNFGFALDSQLLMEVDCV
jgi:hypothetical protein